MSGVGYHWPALAQQAFMAGTCRNNQSISQWCSLSAGDQCCGALCPNAPITGPGTIIAFTVGTMMNMLVTFLWKSEAPYNILWQILSTDGACVALLFRLLLTENRLTEFHAAFVPLAVMSCLPIAVAACTVEVEFMHNLDYNSYVSLWGNHFIEKLEEKVKANPDRIPIALKEHFLDEHREHFHGHYEKDHRVVLEKLIKNSKIFGGVVPRRYLPIIVLGVFGVHLIVWAFLIVMSLTVGATDAFQLNCSRDLPIAYWSRVVGIVAILHWLAMVLLWFLFLASLIKWGPRPVNGIEKPRYRRDPLQMMMKVTMISTLMQAVRPVKEGWSRKREMVRWSISFFVYVAWFSCYVALYILALQKFVMVGDNPFDYGQVAACVGTLGGALTVVRCAVNESAYYRSRNETTHNNSFVARIRNSIFGNKLFNEGDATGQNQLAEQSSEDGESSSSENSVTNSHTRSSSRRRRSDAGSRSSTLAPSPHSGTGRTPTSHQPLSEEDSSEEQDARDRPTRSRSSTLSSRSHHDNGSRRASYRPSPEADPSETLIGLSQSPRISPSPNRSASPSRGRPTRSRRTSSASNASRPVSIIPGLREGGSLRADGLAALQYTGEIPPRAHQALSPGRSVSSERSVHAPLLPRRSWSRASRRYLDGF